MTPPRLPDALTLLVACVLVAASLSYVLPAGQYERRQDPATGRQVVVAGLYHPVAASPVGPFQTFVAIPKGMIDAASVIFLVFLVGGSSTTRARSDRGPSGWPYGWGTVARSSYRSRARCSRLEARSRACGKRSSRSPSSASRVAISW